MLCMTSWAIHTVKSRFMYEPPKVLKEWRIDEPGTELYLVIIYADRTVLSASGRYAQGSGGTFVSWEEFLAGELQAVVRETMGEQILTEVLAELKLLA